MSGPVTSPALAAPHWLRPPVAAASATAQMMADAVPRITTQRLTLRAPQIADYPAYEAVFTSTRAQHIDGPFSPAEAMNDFCRATAGWMLRGAGMWTITRRGQDAALGWIYLWQEQGDPEPELGWILTGEGEGHGYAFEGASAVLARGFDLFGSGGFVSYVGAGNVRSARLAQRLGAVRDARAELQLASMGESDCHVYRHFQKGRDV